MTRARLLLLTSLVLALGGRPAGAQSDAPGPEAAGSCTRRRLPALASLSDAYSDFARVAELAGAAPTRPRLIRRAAEERRLSLCHDPARIPWSAALEEDRPVRGLALELLLPVLRSQTNSAYPTDQNNGALWAGRGLSTAWAGGVALRWGPVSASFAPGLLLAENRGFDFVTGDQPANYDPLATPWLPTRIDLPQRFGERPLSILDAGQSFVRVDAFRLALGLSNENLWWGPALRYPLLMSNTAPGFPHLFLGTAGPRDVGIGRLEAQAIWGRLDESGHFDGSAANDHRLFAGLTFDFEPRGIPGLYLGGSRAYLQNIDPDRFRLLHLLLDPYRGVRDNPPGLDNPEAENQLLSLFVRWTLPAAGFEAYFEWARDDHWADLEELLAVPDASQAYMLGFQKVFASRARWVRLAGELVQLEDALPIQLSYRTFWPFYGHGQIRQGYTHRGQWLGASVGTGASAQFLGVDLFNAAGRTGAYIERIRRNSDFYRVQWGRKYGAEGHDLEFTAGVHQLRFAGDFDISWGASYSRRTNRDFRGLLRDPPGLWPENNWILRLDLAWKPERVREKPR